MVTFTINGIKVQAQEGWTILEAANWMGIEIPTLCYHEGLTPYGACRLCLVEVIEGNKTRLVTSCTYPVREHIVVRTDSKRVIEERKLIIELLLARCPNSKKIQDLASKYGVQKVRFKMENEDCILCGLCVRMCEEQMGAKAIGFINRGVNREVAPPFHIASEVCRGCGACMYICPVVEVQCRGRKSPGEVCGACLSPAPTCLDFYDDLMCYMGATGDCGTCIREKAEKVESAR